MEIIPYLYFKGNAQEALELYKNVFEVEVDSSQIMRFKDQPSPDLKPEQMEMILHAELKTAGGTLYFSDAVGVHSVKVGDNVQININCDSEEQIRRIFGLLSEGATIGMELQNTFWDAEYGALIDRFGIPWSMNFQKVIK